MSDENTLTPAEQSYIDTKGATPLEPVEAPAEPVQPPPVERQDERTVPLPALQEERRERQRLERELAEVREWRAKLEARLNAPPEPEVPDPDNDPVAALKYTRSELDQMKRAQAEERQRAERAQAEQAQTAQFIGWYAAQAQAFAQTNADFTAAYQHLMRERDQELQEAGWSDPNMRAKILEAEERGIATQAYNDGVNPAERLYKLAKRRGYKAAEKPADKPDLKTIAAGQKAAASLSGSGASEEGALSLETVANWSTDQFEAWVSDPKNAKRWDQMKRGAA